MAQTVKKPPAMRETCLRSLGQEDPLQKEMAAHSSILAWRIPWTEEPGGYSPRDRKELDMAEHMRAHTHTTEYLAHQSTFLNKRQPLEKMGEGCKETAT